MVVVVEAPNYTASCGYLKEVRSKQAMPVEVRCIARSGQGNAPHEPELFYCCRPQGLSRRNRRRIRNTYSRCRATFVRAGREDCAKVVGLFGRGSGPPSRAPRLGRLWSQRRRRAGSSRSCVGHGGKQRETRVSRKRMFEVASQKERRSEKCAKQAQQLRIVELREEGGCLAVSENRNVQGVCCRVDRLGDKVGWPRRWAWKACQHQVHVRADRLASTDRSFRCLFSESYAQLASLLSRQSQWPTCLNTT